MKATPYLEPEFRLLNEAIAVFVRKVKSSHALRNTHEDINYGNFFNNKLLVIHSIRNGIPYPLFEQIKNVTPFSDNDWAEYLNLSLKTLQRNKKEPGFLFKPIHTEKILELAEVTKLGNEVFDSNAQFYLWLSTPSFSLGNMTPHELLKDSYGKDLVLSELNRIEHGIFA